MHKVPEAELQANERLFGTRQPVALVTGSCAPRVGRSVAEYLHERGFQLVLHSRQRDTISTAAHQAWLQSGRKTELIVGDVGDEDCVKNWVKQVVGTCGRIDLVVSSAAIWEPKALEKLTSDDYQNFFRANALGTALLNQVFGLKMVEQEFGGAIINIGDWSVVRPYRDFAAYFPSKEAVIGITHSMAVELALRNPRVRVNAILPGPVLLDEAISKDRREKIVSECLLKREGTPDDVARGVHFLATSPFITGVCLPIDGGRTIYAGPSADASAHPRVRTSS